MMVKALFVLLLISLCANARLISVHKQNDLRGTSLLGVRGGPCQGTYTTLDETINLKGECKSECQLILDNGECTEGEVCCAIPAQNDEEDNSVEDLELEDDEDDFNQPVNEDFAHSIVKRDILSLYVSHIALGLSSDTKFFLLDCFAGPGEHRGKLSTFIPHIPVTLALTKSKPDIHETIYQTNDMIGENEMETQIPKEYLLYGSPLCLVKSVKYALKNRQTNINNLYFVFTEKKFDKLENLKRVMKDEGLEEKNNNNLNSNSQVYFQQGNFGDADLITKAIEGYINIETNKQMFSFVDPYGYKAIPYVRMKQLLDIKSEILINLNINGMFRACGKLLPKNKITIDKSVAVYQTWVALFGSEEVVIRLLKEIRLLSLTTLPKTEMSARKAYAIVEAYLGVLTKGTGMKGTYMAMYNSQNALVYFLVFVSSKVENVIMMKEIFFAARNDQIVTIVNEKKILWPFLSFYDRDKDDCLGYDKEHPTFDEKEYGANFLLQKFGPDEFLPLIKPKSLEEIHDFLNHQKLDLFLLMHTPFPQKCWSTIKIWALLKAKKLKNVVYDFEIPAN